jgi:diadenosine tetraphosphate (Ap4A) HIT family hydrolase
MPKRHIGSWFEISKEEQTGLLELLDRARTTLQIEFNPDGYNIGINDGPAAGQTVPHLHMHLIPRYKSDQRDPRGGVRWIIPEKAKYWE